MDLGNSHLVPSAVTQCPLTRGGQPHSRYSLVTGRVGLSQVSTSPLGSHGPSMTSPWSHHVVLLNSSANGVSISTMSTVFHFIFMCMCVCA